MTLSRAGGIDKHLNVWPTQRRPTTIGTSHPWVMRVTCGFGPHCFHACISVTQICRYSFIRVPRVLCLGTLMSSGHSRKGGIASDEPAPSVLSLSEGQCPQDEAGAEPQSTQSSDLHDTHLEREAIATGLREGGDVNDEASMERPHRYDNAAFGSMIGASDLIDSSGTMSNQIRELQQRINDFEGLSIQVIIVSGAIMLCIHALFLRAASMHAVRRLQCAHHSDYSRHR